MPPEDATPRSGWENKVIIIGTILCLLLVGPAFGSFGYGLSEQERNTGEAVGRAQIFSEDGGRQVNCAGVTTLKSEWLSWVNQASSRWLGGDEAALIALIDVESSWDPTASNPSGAAGLGQFVYGTATGIWDGKKVGRGMPEFIGGNDGRGESWTAGTVVRNATYAANPEDARFDPRRSIFATAHLLHTELGAHQGNLYKAYVEGYHSYSNDAERQAAEAAGKKLMDRYNKLVNDGGCRELVAQEVESSGAGANGVPKFKQGDRRWGSVSYGCGATIKEAGCGPTAAAMVLKFYGHEVTPLSLAQESLENGYRVCNSGTAHAFFPYLAKAYDLNIEQNPSWERVKTSLKQGKPVIVSGRGPAPFTRGGHYVVLTGIDENGFISVNDPAGSSARDTSYQEAHIYRYHHFRTILYK